MSMVITVKGLDKLKAKLSSGLYAPSVTRIVTKVAFIGEALMKSRSPRKTGNLQRSITSKLESATQARYGTNVAYGRYLDAPSSRNPHYRSSGPIGEPTNDWATGTLQLTADRAEAVIRDEIHTIESKWAS